MPLKTRNIALSAYATDIQSAGAGVSEPKWSLLIPASTFSARTGRGTWDAGDAATMSAIVDATLKRAGTTDVLVDYDHQSVYSAVPGVGGRAPAAGWIKQFEVRPDGIYGLIEWTAAAASAIQAGEYRYLSPVFTYDAQNRVRYLISAGLTNFPDLDHTAVAASAVEPNGDNMIKIAQALGLSGEASEAAILAAIGTLTGERASIAAAAGLSVTAASADLVNVITSARSAAADPAKFVPVEQVAALTQQIAALQAERTADKADEAVEEAIEKGKLPPALKDWGTEYAKRDLAGFRAYAASAPALVTPGGRPLRATPEQGSDLNDGDIAVMSAMGLSEEAFKATRKKETV